MQRVHKVFSLELFSHARHTTVADPAYAHARLAWAINHVENALCRPSSPERHALDVMGFGAIVLTGPRGPEHVVSFDKGHKTSVSTTGFGIVSEGPRGRDNLLDMLSWLLKAYDYVSWVVRTAEAALASTRPPVFDTASYGDVDHVVRSWIGVPAEAYLEHWKHQRHARLAAVASIETNEKALV